MDFADFGKILCVSIAQYGKNKTKIGKTKEKNWKKKSRRADGKKKRDLAQMLAGNARPLTGRNGTSLFLYCSTNNAKMQGGFQKMSMTMQQMRAAVAALYPFDGWKAKVEKMPDGQILAIYNRQVLNKKGGGAT